MCPVLIAGEMIGMVQGNPLMLDKARRLGGSQRDGTKV